MKSTRNTEKSIIKKVLNYILCATVLCSVVMMIATGILPVENVAYFYHYLIATIFGTLLLIAINVDFVRETSKRKRRIIWVIAIFSVLPSSIIIANYGHLLTETEEEKPYSHAPLTEKDIYARLFIEKIRESEPPLQEIDLCEAARCGLSAWIEKYLEKEKEEKRSRRAWAHHSDDADSYNSDYRKHQETEKKCTPSEALIEAVKYGQLTCAKLLIDAGANVNYKSYWDSASLHYAAMRGDAACMKLLIDAGADVNLADAYGRTPLYYAKAQKKHFVRKQHEYPFRHGGLSNTNSFGSEQKVLNAFRNMKKEVEERNNCELADSVNKPDEQYLSLTDEDALQRHFVQEKITGKDATCVRMLREAGALRLYDLETSTVRKHELDLIITGIIGLTLLIFIVRFLTDLPRRTREKIEAQRDLSGEPPRGSIIQEQRSCNLLSGLTPRGRLTRRQFWPAYILLSILFGTLTAGLPCLLDEIGLKPLQTPATIISSSIFLFGILYPLICKRLHDIGKSSSTFWLVLVVSWVWLPYFILSVFFDYGEKTNVFYPLLTISGVILLIWYNVYFFLDSQRGTNRYGKSLKYPEAPPVTQQATSLPGTRFNSVCYAIIGVFTLLCFIPREDVLGVPVAWTWCPYLLFACFLVGCASVRKNGYNLFTYCCIFTIAQCLINAGFYNVPIFRIFSEQGALIFNIILFIFLDKAAIYITGIQRHNFHPARPLEHAATGWALFLLIQLAVLYNITLYRHLLFIQAMGVMYSLKWSCEWLLHQERKPWAAIVSAISIPLLIVIGCHVLYSGITQDDFVLSSFMREVTKLFLLNVLFIAGFVFTPTTRFIKEGISSTTLKNINRYLIFWTTLGLLGMFIWYY